MKPGPHPEFNFMAGVAYRDPRLFVLRDKAAAVLGVDLGTAKQGTNGAKKGVRLASSSSPELPVKSLHQDTPPVPRGTKTAVTRQGRGRKSPSQNPKQGTRTKTTK